MFYHDRKLQYPVRVTKPNPGFARMLQQAVGGLEGEMRVCLQYLFQAWNCRGPKKYRDMLLDTGTEEIAHIEMLATAIALNLEGAPADMQDQMAKSDPIVHAAMGGMNMRHFLSAGLGAMATDAEGVPFNGSWIVSSGNLAADMYANVTAESTGRLLATRLWEMTDDPGMKDMLAFLIARDTMHQNQWLAVIEELGGVPGVHPIPNSFPESKQVNDYAYRFVSTYHDPLTAGHRDGNGHSTAGTVHPADRAEGRWSQGKSLDGKGHFTITDAFPEGTEPTLGPHEPEAHAQQEEMTGGSGKGFFRKVADSLS